jgi:tRNA (cmo5U34)-methyltransferase
MTHFNEMANQWDSPEKIASTKIIADKIKTYLSRRTAKFSVLDFGCGTGLLAFEFADQAFRIVGIDTSEGMLKVFSQKARQLAGSGIEVESHLCDLEKSDFHEKFDLIVSSTAFHHLVNPESIVKKLSSMLNDKGQLAIVDLDKEDGTFHLDNIGMGVRHFGFSESEVLNWRNNAGFTEATRHIIHVFEKNSRSYPLFLALFSK